MRPLLLTLILACGAVPPPKPPEPTVPGNMARYLAERTVVVVDGPATCAGAAAGRFVLTAAHCTAGGYYQVVTSKGRVSSAIEAYRNEATDLLILYPEDDLHLPELPLARSASWGEGVHAMGHPAQRFFSYGRGSVSHPRRAWRATGRLATQLYLDTYLGGSGGPVVNDRGQLIGLTSRTMPGAGITDIVHLDLVRSALRMLR